MIFTFYCSAPYFETVTAMMLYYRYIIVPLILVIQLVDTVTCPLEATGSGSSSASTSVSNKPAMLAKRKMCPDFKDREEQKYCCPSHIVPGSYYCCSQEHLYRIEAEKAAEIRRQFIKK
ncbi:unnamed protein product [Thelazia callipaeda]|uniref:Thyroglobulin type-1 domain-containing protein n=1 Tax=Thelazia callipaeda TaxID=103827 RepID=A0A0N5D3E9_THECL|nr:unnamed protein product [Thelazia callipaeda]